MSDYIAFDPFGIDDDELATLTPVQAFTLGVEWEILRQFAKRSEELHAYPVHTDNARRIQALLSSHGYQQEWDHRDDWSFVTGRVAE